MTAVGAEIPTHGDLLLEVEDLTVAFPTPSGPVLAVDGVSFRVGSGETLGIVGESGSGKSVSLRALLGLVPSPGLVLSGCSLWRGETDLLAMRPVEERAIRGTQVSMIFQDPLESLDPLISIGDQLGETLKVRAGLSRSAARAEGERLLARVGIPSPRARMRSYPHELSGGMRQRVMIALAISCGPSLILADEPTTALDVTIQDQILTLLAELRAESGMAMVLVSHDLGVIAQECDRVAVMYAGRMVESGTVSEVLERPRHPYTAALIASTPRMPGDGRSDTLVSIRGQLPDISSLNDGCSFAPRCRFATSDCAAVSMTLDGVPDSHRSACPKVEAWEVNHDQ